MYSVRVQVAYSKECSSTLVELASREYIRNYCEYSTEYLYYRRREGIDFVYILIPFYRELTKKYYKVLLARE
jgi:hypothetical protein